MRLPSHASQFPTLWDWGAGFQRRMFWFLQIQALAAYNIAIAQLALERAHAERRKQIHPSGMSRSATG